MGTRSMHHDGVQLGRGVSADWGWDSATLCPCCYVCNSFDCTLINCRLYPLGSAVGVLAAAVAQQWPSWAHLPRGKCDSSGCISCLCRTCQESFACASFMQFECTVASHHRLVWPTIIGVTVQHTLRTAEWVCACKPAWCGCIAAAGLYAVVVVVILTSSAGAHMV